MRGAKTKRDDGVPRKIAHPVRFAADEYEELRRKANQAQISISEFIRRAATNKQIRAYKPPPQVNRKFYQELSAIGVNLNQLVRAMNTANKAGKLVEVDVNAIADLVGSIIRVIKQAQRDTLVCFNDREDNQE